MTHRRIDSLYDICSRHENGHNFTILSYIKALLIELLVTHLILVEIERNFFLFYSLLCTQEQLFEFKN